ncbi:phage baseplate protein [Xenorhabdus sp. SGI240]|uniref:phage baseplate protein n=1 Tax=Xenorhabdus sp. SGI240 TaxID=3158262 RepID=UPI0032B86972
MFGMPELPKMPDIPNWKGIPDAAMDAGISLGGAALINKLFGNYWGIFNQYGIPLLLADSVISLQYQNQYRVVSAPIENGSFATYNKVGEPYKVTVQLSKSSGGTLERGAFLSQLEILAKSTLKFHVITPEFVYTNAAIVGYDIAREAKDGATLLKVNLHLEEIREVTVKYDKEQVKNPDDAKKKDTGDKTQKVESNASSGSLEKMVNDLGDLYDDENKSWLVKGKEGAGILWEGFKGIGKDLSDIKSQAENMVNQISNGSF